MRTKLDPKSIYDGGWKGMRNCAHYVFGFQFGPVFCAINSNGIEDAFDEWDERYGQRIEDVDPDLLDYGSGADAIEEGLNCGDIRINSGGTTVWVDHYEWAAEFATAADAVKFMRGIEVSPVWGPRS